MLVKLQSLDEKRERETAIKICLRVFRNQKEFVKWPLTKPAKRNNVIIAENSFAYEVFMFPILQYSFMMQGFTFGSKSEEALISFRTFRQYFVTPSYLLPYRPQGITYFTKGSFFQRCFSLSYVGG